MDAVVFKNLMYESLLAELGGALDSVADRLIHLHEEWALTSNDAKAGEVLETVLVDIGWWRGQIEGTLDPPSEHQ